MSPDILLSQLGIRYDGTGLQGTPDQIVKRLIVLTAAYDAGVHETPGFVSAPVSPNTFLPENVEKERVLMLDYYDRLHAGDVSKTHKAVDRINTLRMIKSGVEFTPPSDFEIFAHAQHPVGEAARWIIGAYPTYERFFADNGPAIRKYAKAAK